jgi:outer membrane protein X
VHYLFNIDSKFSVYPLVGLTFTGWKWKDDYSDYGYLGDFGDILAGLAGNEDYGGSSSTDTRFGANIGGGISYKLTEQLSIGLEAKYSIVSPYDQFIPGINLTYKF